MKEGKRAELGERFPKVYLQKQIVCLGVPDVYHFGHRELIDLLNVKFNEVVELV